MNHKVSHVFVALIIQPWERGAVGKWNWLGRVRAREASGAVDVNKTPR